MDVKGGRYIELKKCVPSSLKMKLEHIQRFLNQDKASILVGSGFSKNAEMDGTVTMKDWDTLGMDFYKRLYADSPTNNMFGLSPIRLASQIDAAFGRNELDEMIMNSLPDDRVYPGELHKSLLSLPWKDVFTTNYDTLLERSVPYSERHYEVVTNKDTLLYQKSPRIIKLHGSFKDIRPFLMTEEDYRTYPQTHPEFVNTVRQSLIEGILCLIGFSGNDPNFLEWIGWLRDVMGKKAAPVYMITCESMIHDSEIALAQQRRIEIINLHDIFNGKDYDIKEAFDFMFSYLKDTEIKEAWTGKIAHRYFKTKDELTNLTREMQEIRTTYPGWVLLPSKYYSNFDELINNFPFYGDKISKLSLENNELLDFIFELDWRTSISLTPKDVDWFVECIKELIKEEFSNIRTLKYKQTSLKISLLSIYRQKRNYDGFNALSLEIKNDNFYSGNIDLKRKFFYENALFQYSMMNIENIENILCNWTVLKSDYISVLWKSCIYAEIDKLSEAIALLNESLQDITTKLLVNNGSAELLSCYCMIDRMIHFYDFNKHFNQKSNNNEEYDITSIFQKLRDDAVLKEDRKAVVHNHGFNIANNTITVNVGGGYNNKYVSAFRYIMSYEVSGHTMGLLFLCINSSDFKSILPYYAHYDFENTISTLIRTNQYALVNETISRELLKNVSTERANIIFNILHSNILTALKSGNNFTKARAGNVIMPLLARLSIRLSDDNIELLLNTYLDYFTSDNQYYKSEDLVTMYNCLSYNRLKDNINKIYSTPIKSLRNGNDIVLPNIYSSDLRITDSVVSSIILGLKSEDKDVQNYAYIRCAKIYSCFNKQQRNKINKTIINWRSKTELTTNQLYTYNYVDYNDLESKKIDNIIAQDVENIKTADVKNESHSLTIHSFNSLIDRIIPNIHRLSELQAIDILTKIEEFLRENKSQLEKDDLSWYFGGLRSYVYTLFNFINIILKKIKENNIIQDRTIFINLEKQISEYDNAGYNVLSTKAYLALLNVIDEKCILGSIDKKIFSTDCDVRQDAIYALIILSKNNMATEGLIRAIISDVQQTLHVSTSNYIELIIDIILQDRLKPKLFLSFLSFFEEIKNRIDQFTNSEEYKSDILFFTNKLAGVLSIYKADDTKLQRSINTWKELTSRMFNDVRSGFEIGVHSALETKKIK